MDLRCASPAPPTGRVLLTRVDRYDKIKDCWCCLYNDLLFLSQKKTEEKLFCNDFEFQYILELHLFFLG